MAEERGARVERIPLASVRPRKFPARAAATDQEIQRLASSIRLHGLLQPLLVRAVGREYEVVCGQRRYLACKALGIPEIVAVVRSLDDRQAFEVSLAENARRDPLNAEERREILRRLASMFPGRPREELEAWLGPVEAQTSGEPLINWLETLDQKEAPRAEQVAVVVAGRGKAAAVEAPPAASDAGQVVPVSGPPGTGETKVLVRTSAPPPAPASRQGLVWRIRTMLSQLTKSGKLDSELLDNIVNELTDRLDNRPLPDFLDLSYHGSLKRYISRHCLNVSKLAMFLARSLGMGREEIREVAICGLLHDVGMMKVKQEVFTKHAALDQEEWEQVKGHPIEGALLLTKEVVLRDVVARVALEHHEKPDGTGYPAGKKKNETHLFARLINVVDTYGAMVSPRAHRLPMLPYQAMRVVMDDGAKGMLDWDIVQAFVKALSIYPIGSYLRLEGGEVARVVRSQPEIPEKPVIAVIADAQRNLLRAPVEIDLAMTEPMPAFEPIPSPV
ncbi:MAG: ParB/RepB/Spo0J family partition protein [Planctomycetes bacterium]|nr:ParB/RepB/Spo0J family partition protein [Planctomycetota bacterium]